MRAWNFPSLPSGAGGRGLAKAFRHPRPVTGSVGLCPGAFPKAQKDQAEEASRRASTEVEERDARRRGSRSRSCTWAPGVSLCFSRLAPSSEKPVIWSLQCFSEFCEPFQQIDGMQGRIEVVETFSPYIVGQPEAQVTPGLVTGIWSGREAVL